MKTAEEILTHCAQLLAAELADLEVRRRKILRTAFTAGIIVAVIAAIPATVLVMQGVLPAPLFLFVPILALAVVSICLAFSRPKYAREFKQTVIGRLVAELAPDLRFRPDGMISEGEFVKAGLFRQGIDRYRGEDLVAGRVGQTTLSFSEVHAEYKTTTTDSKGRTHTQWHTIFKGLFFIADFHKHFQGVTYVLPDTAEQLFGSFGRWLQSWGSGRGQLIKLEDPEFEREFVVYADDQIEARYLLSPALMSRIVHLKRQAGVRISLAFVDDKVYVAIPIARNMFEPKLFTSAANPAPLREYIADLSLAIGIVDELNLNTRIWSKE